MKSTENLIYNIGDAEDVEQLPEYAMMYSNFPTDRNMTKENLIHLLSGKPIVDLTDEEYVHWIQLDQEALNYVKQHIN
ncbi:2-hydroxymuconic semialdehyde hydrolase [Paucilactobacillus sp. N302-9]